MLIQAEKFPHTNSNAYNFFLGGTVSIAYLMDLEFMTGLFENRSFVKKKKLWAVDEKYAFK